MADRPLALRFFELLGPVVLAGAASAQALAPHELDARGDDARASVPVVLEGFVLAPDGTPAEGALVTSSAGGMAVADASGRYALETEVPRAAEAVEITAVDRTDASRAASTRFELASASGSARVDPLQLVPSGACRPGWVPAFGGQAGLSGIVRALATLGDSLYVGGDFSIAGTQEASHVARWDGTRWKPLASGVDDAVLALTVFDDGNGPALYVGGRFTSAGGVAANRIARWDGSSWAALGSGLGGGPLPYVSALTVFDDGSGAALYAGGSFTTAGGGAANRIAKWNGSSWAALGSGLNGGVSALCLFDDGGGAKLYAAGNGGIAKWNGSSWAALGTGLNGPAYALATHDDGGGLALYVGGDFTGAGGVPASRIAKWNGSSWSAVGGGMDRPVLALASHDDGSGSALYAGGSFTSAGTVATDEIAKWDGSSWSAVGGGLDSESFPTTFALTTYDDGGGAALIAGGDFLTVGTTPAGRIGKWDGSSWSALPGVPGWLNGSVFAQAVHDEGSGPALYAGGSFSAAGSTALDRVARWDGSSWSPLGSGMNDIVFALGDYDDGSGAALYAGGQFTLAGGAPANRIARWDGSAWSALGVGTNHTVSCLTVFDDGGGPDLYAGGSFSTAGGLPASRIARWDGASWSALGPGLPESVVALAVFDDGGGPALHAISGQAFGSNQIARWDGASWTTLVTGLECQALATFDDGSGAALYVGGSFTVVDGVSANRVARWDGTSWSALGSGLVGGPTGPDGWASELYAYDVGSGPTLYVGGLFSTAGGLAARNVARWDGSSWAALGSGLSDDPSLVGHDDGSGPALYAAGNRWMVAPETGDGPLAKWGCALATSTSKVRPR